LPIYLPVLSVLCIIFCKRIRHIFLKLLLSFFFRFLLFLLFFLLPVFYFDGNKTRLVKDKGFKIG